MATQKNFRRIPKISDVELKNSNEQNNEQKLIGRTAPVPPIELMHLANKIPTRKKQANNSKELVKKIEDISITPAS